MRIVFMGTPDFAAIVLRGICAAGHEVVGVISQPDKPKNRGMQMVPTPVKEEALKRNIPVYQPETLRNQAILPYLQEMQPDCIVVVAYGKLLPKYVLSYPSYGCINMHASLLPKYRGAAPIQWSILNGETETGITSMHMAEGLDTGDMILREKVAITSEDTAESLHDKLAEAAVRVAVDTLRALEDGTAPRIPQTEEASSYAPMLTKELGEIHWQRTTKEILNQIRGLNPWPGAYSYKEGQRFKVISAKQAEGQGAPGQVIAGKHRLIVATGDGALEIMQMQMPGKRAMEASACMQGNHFAEGILLGE
ncbi:MAG: methionyl-tRNA formyltransferase [Clostridia bacterium]|nr:methionyl-tRNA formyltransferase [Clostridia bacterium]